MTKLDLSWYVALNVALSPVIMDMPNIFGNRYFTRISNQLSEYLSHRYNLSIGLDMNLIATKTPIHRQNLATISILFLLIAALVSKCIFDMNIVAHQYFIESR